jgi:hypothetical protein
LLPTTVGTSSTGATVTQARNWRDAGARTWCDGATFVTGFLPSINGFRFANRWPHGTPFVRLPGPIPITLGDASSGLCGGMALAVADLFHAHRPPPPWTSPPGAGSAGFAYLRARLIDSWDVPWGAARFLSWAMSPDGDTFPGLAGLGRRTLRELPKLRAALDAGAPVLLGLVTVHSFQPAEVAHCHIVLAHGYDAAPSSLTVAVYDPNSPGRDDIRITVDTPTGGKRPRIKHNVGLRRPIRGCFVLPTVPQDPAALTA